MHTDKITDKSENTKYHRQAIVLIFLILIGTLVQGNANPGSLWTVTDRDFYFTGESLLFSAFIPPDFNPDNEIVYVTLFHPNGKLLDKQIFQPKKPVFSGSMALPDTLSSGVYLMEVYTKSMLDVANNFRLRKLIPVYSMTPPKNGAELSKPEKGFFIKNGTLISGIHNKIICWSEDFLKASTYFITTNDSLPVHADIQVEKGFAIIEFTPEPLQHYTLKQTTADSSHQLFSFGKPEGTGISLIADIQKDGLVEIRVDATPGFLNPSDSLYIYEQNKRIASFAVLEGKIKYPLKLSPGLYHGRFLQQNSTKETVFFYIPENSLTSYQREKKPERMVVTPHSLITLHTDGTGAYINPPSQAKVIGSVNKMFRFDAPNPFLPQFERTLSAFPVAISNPLIYSFLPKTLLLLDAFLTMQSADDFYLNMADSDGFIPDDFGISGKIILPMTGKSISNQMILLTRTGKDAFIQYTYADLQGRFRFDKPGSVSATQDYVLQLTQKEAYCEYRIQVNDTALLAEGYTIKDRFSMVLNEILAEHSLLQPESYQTQYRANLNIEYQCMSKPKIVLDNHAKTSLGQIKIPQFLPTHPNVQIARNYKTIVNQVAGIYEADTLPNKGSSSVKNLKINTTQFYGEPDLSINLDDYIEFNSMEEMLRNVVMPVKIRKTKDGKPRFVMQGEKSFLDRQPVILIDGLLTFETEVALNMDPDFIQRFDVVYSKEKLDSLPFIFTNGIFAIYTRTNRFDFAESDDRLKITMKGLQEPIGIISYKNTTDAENTARKPVLAPTVFWETNTGINSAPPAQIYHPDPTGDFEALLYIMDNEGNIHTRYTPYQVRIE